ncbi:MAG: hypothetical protein AAF385_10245 [Pseudomonadota bacterium]
MNGSKRYRKRVNCLAVIASSAFAGANLFIGLSMGFYWLMLDPLAFVSVFWPMFTSFLFTVMPLFLLTLLGLVLSARIDWHDPNLKKLWLYAIALYAVVSLITVLYHIPENLRLREGLYSDAEASAARMYWLVGHIPRMVLAVAIPLLCMASIHQYRDQSQ